MRKVALAILTLVVSANIFAASPDINSAIFNSLGKQNGNGQSPSMVYGGKDISRSIVATADKSAWTKQQTIMIL